MSKRSITLLVLLSAFLVTLLLNLLSKYQQGTKPTAPTLSRVVEVNDGDTITIVLDGKTEKVRLIGIDAPELDQRPWGQKAKKHLGELLKSSQWTVSLEFDVDKRDKYGRLLCYVWTPDGMMLNSQMLKDGYAMLYTIPPNVQHVDELTKAQHEAQEKKLGIWGNRGLKEVPSEYRKKHPRL